MTDLEDDEPALLSLQQELEDGFALESSSTADVFLVKVTLASGSIALRMNSHHSVPIVSCALICSFSMDMFTSHLKGQFCVNNAVINDLYSPSPIVSCILSPRTKEELGRGGVEKPFVGTYRITKGQISAVVIDIKAAPFKICLNEACTSQLLAFVVPRGSVDATAIYITNKLTVLISPHYEHRAAMEGGSLKLSLDVEAPVLVVPIKSDQDSGSLYFDLGHLVLSAEQSGSTFLLSSQLLDINVCLPLTVKFTRVNDQDDLIEPFSLSFSMDTMHTETANSSIYFQVKPRISCVTNQSKFTRLLR